MEENINIEICETNRRKEQVIINKAYKFNLHTKKEKSLILKYIDVLKIKL